MATRGEINKLVGLINESIADVVSEFRGLAGFDIPGLVRVIRSVVISVETAVKELGVYSSDDKQRAAVIVLNQAVNIPMVPEWLEGKVFGFVVDVVVNIVNGWFGKGWAEALLRSDVPGVNLEKNIVRSVAGRLSGQAEVSLETTAAPGSEAEVSVDVATAPASTTAVEDPPATD